MTNELNFYNLTVKYDGDKFSKKELRKFNRIFWLGCVVLLILLFATIALSALLVPEPSFWILFIVTILSGIIIYGGAFGLSTYIDKITPRHYELLTWLMRFKKEEIEVYWINDRYGVMMFTSGWHHKELDYILKEEYNITDTADKAYPVHMTIDLTQDTIDVTVRNK